MSFLRWSGSTYFPSALAADIWCSSAVVFPENMGPRMMWIPPGCHTPESLVSQEAPSSLSSSAPELVLAPFFVPDTVAFFRRGDLLDGEQIASTEGEFWEIPFPFNKLAPLEVPPVAAASVFRNRRFSPPRLPMTRRASSAVVSAVADPEAALVATLG